MELAQDFLFYLRETPVPLVFEVLVLHGLQPKTKMKMGRSKKSEKLRKFEQSLVIAEQGIDEEDPSSTQAILYRFLLRRRYPAELRP